MNGLKEAVSGKEYDTPAYRVIATHVTSDGEVHIIFPITIKKFQIVSSLRDDVLMLSS